MNKDYTNEFYTSQDPPLQPSFHNPPGQNQIFAEEFQKFEVIRTALHRGGSFSYFWYCSEERKAKILKNGRSSYTETKHKRTVWYPSQTTTALKFQNGENAYFCVHPTNKAGNRYQRAKNQSKKDEPVVQVANCLFAEFDAKDFYEPFFALSRAYKDHLKRGALPWDFDASGSEEMRRIGMNAAWEHIHRLGLKPTVIINSGGGFHAYFLFNETHVISDQTRGPFCKLQARFVKAIGSDDGAKDLARVLRVPGSINFKGYYECPLPVTVVSSNEAITYSIGELENFIQEFEVPLFTGAYLNESKDHPPAKEKDPPKPRTKRVKTSKKGTGSHADRQKAACALKRLSQARCDSYDGWLKVGMALYHAFGGAEWARKEWDHWSKQSRSYDEGATEAKWPTFAKEGNTLSLGSLILWANEDDPLHSDFESFFTFEELKAKIKEGRHPDSEHDLSMMIDSWTDSAANLTGREVNQLCKLLKKAKVTGKTIDYWRADIKEVREERSKRPDPNLSRSSVTPSVPPDTGGIDLLAFEINDAGSAEAFIALHGEKFRHVEEWGWLYYTGTHWEKRGGDKHLFETMKEVLRARIGAALNRISDEDKLRKYLTRCAPTTKNVKACLTQLRHAIVLDAHPDTFDSHKFLLNTQNGVLNLTSGQLLQHSPSLYMTFCLEIAYNPHADQSLIITFLQGLGLSDKVIVYLQEAAGYTLTGSTREECLFYIYGPTRSGKGTFMAALRSLLGNDLSAEIKFEILTGDKRNDADAQNFALAPLKPCRFIVASESGKYSTLNEAKIKQLTGGDSVYCAFKGKTHFNYTPQFKIWLTSNHSPKADVDDDAIWKSRLKLIEFPNSFLGQEDKGLKDMLMNDPAYQEALLAWAAEGAFKWYHSPNGLVVPDEVRAATEKARTELDNIQQWLDECTESKPETRTPNSKLYQSYETWCDDNGVSPKKKRAFGRAMKAKGYTSDKWWTGLKTVRGFIGLSLIYFV